MAAAANDEWRGNDGVDRWVCEREKRKGERERQ